jgi:predicted glycosyltransferase
MNTMRIWFDISNSPHVILFHALILDLEHSGHEIIITTRPLANTIDLLEQKGLPFKIIGRHYGKNIIKKIVGFPIRVIQLFRYLKKKKIQFAVGQSSFHLPLVARLLGVPSVYTNDNEHAAGNIISFYFANQILVPNGFRLNYYLNNTWIKSKMTYYPGVKEGIYLWMKHQELLYKRSSSHNNNIKIYIRPEPQTAQYYSGALYFLDDIILQIQHCYSVVILTRNKDQYDHYSQAAFSYCAVPSKPLTLENITSDCTLFIGAGGSMTREFALLGIPTISVYQDKLLSVDEILLNNSLLYHYPNLKLDHIMHILSQENKPFFKPNDLLKKGKLAYEILRAHIVANCGN